MTETTLPQNGHDIEDVEKFTTEQREDVSPAMHHDQLTEEEMVVAKKLRKKIDIRIMPMVILVYLMNYIDRYVLSPMTLYFHLSNLGARGGRGAHKARHRRLASFLGIAYHLLYTETITPRRGSKGSRRTSGSWATSTRSACRSCSSGTS